MRAAKNLGSFREIPGGRVISFAVSLASELQK